jgi:PRTRC genetic system protein E
MFKELSELAQTTKLTVLISGASKGRLAVTVIPTAAKGESSALSVPLEITGTPEELDSEFPSIFGKYADARSSLAKGLESALAVMDAAKKAAQDKAAEAARNATVKTVGPAAKAAPMEEREGEPGEEEAEGAETAGSEKAVPAAKAKAEVSPSLFD